MVAFEGKSSSRDISINESYKRENSCNSCIFFFVFNIIYPLLPVDVGLMLNHIKSSVLVFYGDLSRLLANGRSSMLPLLNFQLDISLLLYRR